MVIDGSKGVEPRTIKLLEVCRMRDTPIVTFINKLDREILDPIELLDEVERILSIECAPVTWPIGMGRNFKGCYHMLEDRIYCFESGHGHSMHNFDVIEALESEKARLWLDEEYDAFVEEIELVKGASYSFDIEAFREGRRTPVFLVRHWLTLVWSMLWIVLLKLPHHQSLDKQIRVVWVWRKKISPVSFSRFRPIWILDIEIESPLCVFARDDTVMACGCIMCGLTVT